MEISDLRPKIFSEFPEVRTNFAVGRFSFNLSSPSIARQERRELLEKLAARPEQLFALGQTHGNRILDLEEAPVNKDFLSPPCGTEDGAFTGEKDFYLVVRSADCLPILVYHPAGLIGAVHAGWRGTAKGTVIQLLDQMRRKFSAPLAEFRFFFGPAARSCCFEVSKYFGKAPDFERTFARHLRRETNGKVFLDFVGANRDQLVNLGVQEGQIEDCGICTVHEIRFPSYRRDKWTDQQVLLSIIGQR